MKRRSSPRIGSRAGLLVALLGACAHHAAQTKRLADGSFEVSCRDPLWKCLAAVEELCKGGSYAVLSGGEEQSLYGTPGASVESRKSRAVVRCLRPGERLRVHDEPAPVALPPAKPPAKPPRAPAESERAAAPPACVPGTTQSCVGAGACSGGQACLADGSGFGPCDCGPSPAPASSSSAPSSAP